MMLMVFESRSSFKRYVRVVKFCLVWLLSLLMIFNVEGEEVRIVKSFGQYDCKIGCPLSIDPICDVINQITYQNSCLAQCQQQQQLEVDSSNFIKDSCSDATVIEFDGRESSNEMIDLDTIHRYAREGCKFVGIARLGNSDRASTTKLNNNNIKSNNDGNNKPVASHHSIRIIPEGDMYICDHGNSSIDTPTTAAETIRKKKLLRRNVQAATDDLVPANIGLDSVIGTDTRAKVTDTTSDPYKMIGLITKPGCTGSIIHERWILTAGHCHFDPTLKTFFDFPKFGPGTYRDSSNTLQYPYGLWSVEFVSIPSEYVGGDSNYDFSLMRISPDSSGNYIGGLLGMFSLRTAGSSLQCGTPFTNNNWRVTGYPSDKGLGDMYDSGVCDSWSLDCSKPRFTHTCDTYAGESGAPIYDASTKTIYGVHTSGGTASNKGVYLNDAHISYIQTVIFGESTSSASISSPFSSSSPTTAARSGSYGSTTSVTLTNSYTNVGAGVMFQVEAKKTLQITQLAVYLQSTTEATTVTVYTRVGSFNGYETSTSGWTQVLSKSGVVGQGGNSAVYLPSFSSPLSITAGNSRSFLIATSSNQLLYQAVDGSKGDYLISNSDLVLYKGAAYVSSSPSNIYSPRILTGTFKYQVLNNEAAATVDEANEVADTPVTDNSSPLFSTSISTPEDLLAPITGTSLSISSSAEVMDMTYDALTTNGSQIKVQLSVQTDNFGTETSWKVYKHDGSNDIVQQSPSRYESNQLYMHEFIIDPSSCYMLEVLDSYGDGMCCEFGSGSYSLSDANGEVLISGNSYRSSQASLFGKC